MSGTIQPTFDVIARLGGRGYLGPGHEITDPAELAAFQQQLAQCIGACTLSDQGYCMDARGIVEVGGVTDPKNLGAIVAPQLAGGTVLQATKASVAAGTRLVEGARSFVDAYERVATRAEDQGFADAGHGYCGAAAKAEVSVTDRRPVSYVRGVLQAVGAMQTGDTKRLAAIDANVRRHAEDHPEFFADWSPDVHRELVESRTPGGYAKVRTGDDHAKGHHPSGLVLVPHEGRGLAKNRLIDASGRMALGYTPWFADQLAVALAETPEEAARLRVAFNDDLVQVADHLVAPMQGQPGEPDHFPGLAVFAPVG